VGDPSYLHGVLVTLRTDQVQMPDGDLAQRDVIEHPGAVAIVALDGDGQVLLIRHYRHPVGHLLWEIPAGLRDVAGEDPRATAERELLEEAGYRARDWQELADFFTSPGILTERVRVFLARGLTFVPESERGGNPPEHEEAHLLAVGAAASGSPPFACRRPAQWCNGSGYLVRVRRPAGRVRGAAGRRRAARALTWRPHRRPDPGPCGNGAV
jgi:8-oxo-dGTP pyrophosphatase MutT (NUDIX family)